MPRPHHLSSPAAFAQAVRFEGILRSHRARMELGVARAGRTGGRVLVGPWLSEIGFEVLYWIPFLRRLLGHHGVRPEQVTAISRGGVAGWYGDVATDYVDILDLLDVEEYRRAQHERVAEAGDQKQYRVTDLDRELWRRAGGEGAVRVHPLVMYSRLRYFWAGEKGLRELERRCRFARLPAPGPPGVSLPERFVAAKPYFSSCFPDTSENRRFVGELIDRVAETVDVVLLTTGLRLDDHSEWEGPGGGRVHSLGGALDARDNLAVQTAVIARAHGLLSTYGGPAYLGPALGVPTAAFHSLDNHNLRHLEAARLAADRCGSSPIEAVRSGSPGAVDRLTAAVLREPSVTAG